jgi:hypothetical protein
VSETKRLFGPFGDDGLTIERDEDFGDFLQSGDAPIDSVPKPILDELVRQAAEIAEIKDSNEFLKVQHADFRAEIDRLREQVRTSLLADEERRAEIQAEHEEWLASLSPEARAEIETWT